MPPLQGLLVLGCVVVGVALSLGALSELRHALWLWRARRVAAGSVGTSAATVLDVRGRVLLDEPLTAPLAQRPCAQWLLVVSRAPARPGQPRDGLSDVQVFKDARPFWVDDGTGRVRVHSQTRPIPLSELRSRSEPLTRLTPALDALLSARLNQPAAMWCHRRDVTVVESALFQGDLVSLVARREPGPRLVLEPLHVTCGRPRVVALRTALRAGVVASLALLFFAVAQWLR